MMDWTDRHCRYFHRLITRHARLYTEMVTTGALLHGDVPRHLDFDAAEHPLGLQLGGSEPADLAAAARLALQWGYDEINLNCGCPSERVQRGAFGACLMAEAPLVREGVSAMREAVVGAIPVTVKHRIGIDQNESYDFVRDFVATVAEGGCQVFIVHARNAWLKGLSPKDNREIPPLRYDFVHRLKRELPELTFVINGGFVSPADIADQLQHVDGVMVGRQAYHQPALMAGWDRLCAADSHAHRSGTLLPPVALAAHAAADPGDAWRADIEDRMVDYMTRMAPLPRPNAARHMLGLWAGRPGARLWRRVWSDHRLKTESPLQVQRLATAARLATDRASAVATACRQP